MVVPLGAVPLILAHTACLVFGACVQAFYTRYLAEDDVNCTNDDMGFAKKIWDVIPAIAFIVLGLIGLIIAMLIKPKPKPPPPPKPTIEQIEVQIQKIIGFTGQETVPTQKVHERLELEEVEAQIKNLGVSPSVAIELIELVACDGTVNVQELSRLLSQSLSSALFIGATVRLLRERMDRSTQSQLDSHAGKLDAIEAKIQEVLDLENTLRMTTEEAKHEIINQQGVYREDLAKDIKGTMLCPGRQ